MALADQLVSFWALSEATGATRLDSVVASANNLTDTGSVVQVAGLGSLGSNAADFAIGTYLSRADNALLSPTAAMTFFGWFQFDSLGEDLTIVNKSDSSTNISYYLQYIHSTTLLKFSVCELGFGIITTVSATTFGAPSTGVPYFMVCRYNGTNISICVNGTANTNTTAYSAGIFDGTAAFELGADSLNSQFYKGKAQYVGLYSRAISDSEVTQLYNSGAGMSYAEMTGGGSGGTDILQSGYTGTQIVQY